MPSHLFVFERDITTHPSAQFALRNALALARRREPVTLYLCPGACASAGDRPVHTTLAPLAESGARVLLDRRLCANLRAQGGPRRLRAPVRVGTERDLALLLRAPDTIAIWC